jgi:hypothetical protein
VGCRACHRLGERRTPGVVSESRYGELERSGAYLCAGGQDHEFEVWCEMLNGCDCAVEEFDIDFNLFGRIEIHNVGWASVS